MSRRPNECCNSIIDERTEGTDRLQRVVTRFSNQRTWPPVLHQVVRTIRSRNLFQQGQHLLVAISGGPDSVALLALLGRLRSRWRLTLTAVHCNYGLRGSESDEDEAFVAAFCQELGIPLHVRKLSLEGPSHCSSLQARARDLRYQVMTEIAEQCRADRIAVGHTADDQAETVLLWVLRGAGLTGLSGMPAFRDGVIIRPLYETRRQEILTFLQNAGLVFRVDSSNATPKYLRNRIRLEALPVLSRLIPSSVNALCRLADICREDDRYLSEQSATISSSLVSQDSLGDWVIDRGVLQTLPRAMQRRILRGLFQQRTASHRSPSIRTIDRIIHLVSKRGSVSSLDVTWGCVMVEQTRVRVVPHHTIGISNGQQECATSPQLLSVPGQVLWPGTGQQLQGEEWTQERTPAHLGKCQILVDADRISQPLTVRTWAPGDRFYPSGMNGHSKKLQDFFTDLKIPIRDRSFIPLLVAPEGIVWVAGYRQDQRWIPAPTTKRRLAFTVKDVHSRGRNTA
jgi:tRNA(Ile)-lysidine synthase